MRRGADTDFSPEQRREIEAWIEANIAGLPDSVRAFLTLHLPYLSAEGDPKRALEAAWRELRRALHITPSSEKRRPSGSPLADVPRQENHLAVKSEREILEDSTIQFVLSSIIADQRRATKACTGTPRYAPRPAATGAGEQ